MKQVRLLLFLMGAIGTFQACQSEGKGSESEMTTPSAFDLGKVEHGIYHNDFFDLNIPLPDSFHIQSHEETNQLLNLGLESLGNSDEEFKKKLVASSVKNAYLLTAFKYEIGTEEVDFNPSIIVVAENVQLVPGIKNGKEYLDHTQKLLQHTKLDYSFKSPITEKKISNKTFGSMIGFLTIGGMTITQEYFTRVENGFALNIIISYLDEADKKELENVIQSITYGAH